MVKVIRIDLHGNCERKDFTVCELVSYMKKPNKEAAWPSRQALCQDLRTFLHQNQYAYRDVAIPDNSNVNNDPSYPKILPRPLSGYFIVDLMFLRILCCKDHCLIMDHAQDWKKLDFSTCRSAIDMFVEELVRNIQKRVLSQHSSIIEDQILDALVDTGYISLPFELMVLDTALHVIVRKMKRHLQIIEPVLENMLKSMLKQPSRKWSERIYNFKKTIQTFGGRVDTLKQALDNILSKEDDMSYLYLSHMQLDGGNEEVELIVLGYRDDLRNMQLKVKDLFSQIHDTRGIVNLHLDEVRNGIMNISLIMEMFMLGAGFAAAIAGVFGMNLESSLETNKSAFYIVTGFVILVGVFVVAIVFKCLYNIQSTRVSSVDEEESSILNNFLAHAEDISEIMLEKSSKQHNRPTRRDINILFSVLESAKRKRKSDQEIKMELARKLKREDDDSISI